MPRVLSSTGNKGDKTPYSLRPDKPLRGSRMPKPSRGDTDHFHDECGVFGVFGHPDAAALTALGLHALQHRGQEAAGIVAYDGGQFNAHRGMGLVGDNFGSPDVIRKLPRHSAI